MTSPATTPPMTAPAIASPSPSPFEHYLYVLECEDGNLYTGYTTDVAARVAAHQAGTGAKYTRSHAPVRLLAQARFYTKERAMSAEALFKRLTRSEKETLIAQAQAHANEDERPFEDVLRASLPGFGDDTAREFVNRRLAQNVDAVYRDFMLKLVPTVSPKTMVGVRTPILRTIAKELARRDDADTFMRALPHRLFEENQVHAFAIGREKDYNVAMALYDEFLPHVDNWATCDQLPVKVLAKRPEETLAQVKRWLASQRCYTMRFAVGVLMRLYLDELFDSEHLDLVASAHMPDSAERPEPASEAYYIDMMRAWYFAEALAKQEQATLPYLKRCGRGAPLDEWTRHKAIQKAIESRRIAPALKDHLRSCR